jgi:hypothetical protein
MAVTWLRVMAGAVLVAGLGLTPGAAQATDVSMGIGGVTGEIDPQSDLSACAFVVADGPVVGSFSVSGVLRQFTLAAVEPPAVFSARLVQARGDATPISSLSGSWSDCLPSRFSLPADGTVTFTLHASTAGGDFVAVARCDVHGYSVSCA